MKVQRNVASYSYEVWWKEQKVIWTCQHAHVTQVSSQKAHHHQVRISAFVCVVWNFMMKIGHKRPHAHKHTRTLLRSLGILFFFLDLVRTIALLLAHIHPYICKGGKHKFHGRNKKGGKANIVMTQIAIVIIGKYYFWKAQKMEKGKVKEIAIALHHTLRYATHSMQEHRVRKWSRIKYFFCTIFLHNIYTVSARGGSVSQKGWSSKPLSAMDTALPSTNMKRRRAPAIPFSSTYCLSLW